jgi:hypothetical protein
VYVACLTLNSRPLQPMAVVKTDDADEAPVLKPETDAASAASEAH